MPIRLAMKPGVSLHRTTVLPSRRSANRLIVSSASGRVRGPVAIAPPGGNDFCHAGAVAEAVLEVALRRPPSDRYVLSGEALSYTQAFRLMRQAAGRAPRVVTAPAWMVRIAGRAGDGWGAITGREPDVNSAAAAVACQPHHFSSARAIAPSCSSAAARG